MKRLLTTISLSAILFACNGVRQVSISNDQFYSNDKVEDKLSKYDVYFHAGSSTFKLDQPTMENDSLAGVPVMVDPKTIIENPVTPQELLATRNDLHVYLDDEEAKDVQEKIAKGEKIRFGRKEVKEVKLLAKDEAAVFASVGLIILFVILGLLIVYLIILAFAKAANDGSNGSNSNSNSGDSGSGGNGGGSNSGSGCYVATMVYGSYDAPKVMVLRAFRDQFLAKYSWGNQFIRWYYANSPSFVAKHEKNRFLGGCIRGILNVVVWCLKPFFKA